MPTRRMPTFEIVHPVPVCAGVWKREINVKIKSGLDPEFQRRSRAARAALYWRVRGVLCERDQGGRTQFQASRNASDFLGFAQNH